jgi:hypothetical protein
LIERRRSRPGGTTIGIIASLNLIRFQIEII